MGGPEQQETISTRWAVQFEALGPSERILRPWRSLPLRAPWLAAVFRLQVRAVIIQWPGRWSSSACGACRSLRQTASFCERTCRRSEVWEARGLSWILLEARAPPAAGPRFSQVAFGHVSVHKFGDCGPRIRRSRRSWRIPSLWPLSQTGHRASMRPQWCCSVLFLLAWCQVEPTGASMPPLT